MSRYLASIILLTGCFSQDVGQASGSLAGLVQKDGASSESVELEQNSTGELPFTLEIVQEINTGTELYLLVKLTVRTHWDPALVALRLSGFAGAELVNVETRPLSELFAQQSQFTKRSVHSGTRDVVEYTFPLTMKAGRATDYQVELLWGDEAPKLVATSSGHNPQAATGLQATNVKLQKRYRCDTEPCQLSFVVQADLVNSGTELIDAANVQIGYVWKATLPTKEPVEEGTEYTETVKLTKLDLAPGSVRSFQFDLKESVPEKVDGEYLPLVKLLTFN